MHLGIRLSETKLWSFAIPTRLNDTFRMGTQHRSTGWGGTRHAKDVLLLVSVELLSFRGKPEIPIRGLVALGLPVGCSFTMDVMD